MSGDMAVLRSLRSMADDMRDFLVPSAVPRVLYVPSALEFMRDYVAPGKPVVFCSLTHEWPAMEAWDVPYLRHVAGEVEVTVNTTPNGLGDAVTPDPATGELLFVKPEERRMPLSAFLDHMEADEAAAALAVAAGAGIIGGSGGSGGSGGGGGSSREDTDVMYFSHQNDCLRDVLKVLFKDVEPFFDFAAEALGPPEAVNIWIGNERSNSSLHKDHYENMYTVVRGVKRFTLLPPTDVAFLYEREFPGARYVKRPDGFSIVRDGDGGTVPWIPVDPGDEAAAETFPLYANATPLVVDVRAGETLFLPALWFHKVEQIGLTVAVNYWHDMKFDSRWVLYNLASTLGGLLDGRAPGGAGGGDAPVVDV